MSDSVEICAVVDRVPTALTDARVLGDGPYVVVADAAGTLEERLSSRLALFRSLTGVACLPFRLGATLADDGAAIAWLEARRPAIDRALARTDKRVEFDLHLAAAPAAPPTTAAGPGTRHVQTLAARYARLPADVASRALETCRDLPAVEETAVVDDGGFIAFLVSDAPAFARAARELRLDGARWSGPWPAFTFAARWIEA